jgi:hypothetical protein
MDEVKKAYARILHEEQEEVNENLLKHAAIAATLAGAIATGVSTMKPHEDDLGNRQTSGTIEKISPNHPDNLFNSIKSKFTKVDDETAHEIVKSAIKHGKPDFPQPHHLVAIAGVESGMRPDVSSNLKNDPATGLMQVRPKVWGIDKKEFSTIDGQIKHGAAILTKYHKTLGDPDKAIMAYNIGVTNFNKGKKADAADRYHTKVSAEIKRIAD